MPNYYQQPRQQSAPRDIEGESTNHGVQNEDLASILLQLIHGGGTQTPEKNALLKSVLSGLMNRTEDPRLRERLMMAQGYDSLPPVAVTPGRRGQVMQQSASDFNRMQDARQNKWNTQANVANYVTEQNRQGAVQSDALQQALIAQQGQDRIKSGELQGYQMRELPQSSLGLHNANPLVNVNGVDPRFVSRRPMEEAPTYSQIQQSYYGRSIPEQISIYQKGGAPFVGNDAMTKMIQANTEAGDTEDLSQIHAAYQNLTNGDWFAELDPATNLTRFFRMAEDPNATASERMQSALTGGKKIKTPLNRFQMSLIDKAHARFGGSYEDYIPKQPAIAKSVIPENLASYETSPWPRQPQKGLIPRLWDAVPSSEAAQRNIANRGIAGLNVLKDVGMAGVNGLEYLFGGEQEHVPDIAPLPISDEFYRSGSDIEAMRKAVRPPSDFMQNTVPFYRQNPDRY